jgi:large subunit ribosomal protein L4
MATEATLPTHVNQEYKQGENVVQGTPPSRMSKPHYARLEITSDLSASTVMTTIYNFPSMEPLRFESYNSKHLHLPLRRDILHSKET